MKFSPSALLLGLVNSSLAFPALLASSTERTIQVSRRMSSKPGFDATKQHIDVSGKHAFVPPGPNDQRGPCPGLNALANHNFIPHNGVATIQQFVDANTQVYGMGVDLALALSTIGAVFEGDLTGWSIDGPTNAGLPLGFLMTPRGIGHSHSKYETDGSPTRGDLYPYGNASDLVMSQWEEMYALQSGKSNDESNYDLDLLMSFRASRVAHSKATNPYFFVSPFAGNAVQPAAYSFIYRFMGNKSAEHPEGVLTKDVLKSFFAMEGEEGNFVYKRGHERIPNNWYRRAIGDDYGLFALNDDKTDAGHKYPEFNALGGNTGTVNSFTGINSADVSGGVYNAETLLQGNNAICYAFQFLVQVAPDSLFGVVTDVGNAVGLLNATVGEAIKGMGCPQMSSVNTAAFDRFPGWTRMQKNGGY